MVVGDKMFEFNTTGNRFINRVIAEEILKEKGLLKTMLTIKGYVIVEVDKNKKFIFVTDEKRNEILEKNIISRLYNLESSVLAMFTVKGETEESINEIEELQAEGERANKDINRLISDMDGLLNYYTREEGGTEDIIIEEEIKEFDGNKSKYSISEDVLISDYEDINYIHVYALTVY
jgi:hypothetical protein